MLRVFPESQVIFGLLHKFLNRLKASMAKDPDTLNKLPADSRVMIRQQVEMAVSMLMQTSCFPSKAPEVTMGQHRQLTQVLESYVMDYLYDGLFGWMRLKYSEQTSRLRDVLSVWVGRSQVCVFVFPCARAPHVLVDVRLCEMRLQL